MNSVKMYNGEKQKMTYSRLSIYLKSVKHLLNSKEEQSENKPFNFNEGRDFHITIDKERMVEYSLMMGTTYTNML